MSGEQHDHAALASNRIASTIVHNRWWVSTIELDINLNPLSEVPLTCETMVFDLDTDGPESVMTRRYPDPGTARRGHRRIVKQIREGGAPPT